MPRRHKKMKGGFWDTLSGWGTSISEGASSAWNKTKNATTSSYSSPTPTYTPATAPTSAPTTVPYISSTGGRKQSRKMRGGFKDNTPTTGLASHAASISGIKTAQPHNMVGGKTRKHRKHRHQKSYKHRKH